jgi:hypothetical protein
VIHIMTHGPGNGVPGNGHCETEPPTPRSLAAPVVVMPCLCVLPILLTRWLALLHADIIDMNVRFIPKNE